MNSRAEQRFVGIDISDSAKEALVQQQGFDSGFALAQERREAVNFDFERFRAEFSHARGKSLAQLQPAKLPNIVVQQRAAIQAQNGVRVLSSHAVHEQLSGHTQMDHETLIAFQFEHQKLAVPAQRSDSLSCQTGRSLVGIAAQDSQPAELGAQDTPAANPWLKRACNRFNFGKFRHVRQERSGGFRYPRFSLRRQLPSDSGPYHFRRWHNSSARRAMDKPHN